MKMNASKSVNCGEFKAKYVLLRLRKMLIVTILENLLPWLTVVWME